MERRWSANHVRAMPDCPHRHIRLSQDRAESISKASLIWAPGGRCSRPRTRSGCHPSRRQAVQSSARHARTPLGYRFWYGETPATGRSFNEPVRGDAALHGTRADQGAFVEASDVYSSGRDALRASGPSASLSGNRLSGHDSADLSQRAASAASTGCEYPSRSGNDHSHGDSARSCRPVPFGLRDGR